MSCELERDALVEQLAAVGADALGGIGAGGRGEPIEATRRIEPRILGHRGVEQHVVAAPDPDREPRRDRPAAARDHRERARELDRLHARRAERHRPDLGELRS